MPLPFSFSTQRQSFEGESPVGPSVAAVPEKVMNQAPGFISTEPLPGIYGKPFPPAPAEMALRHVPVHPQNTHQFSANQAYSAKGQVAGMPLTAAVSPPGSSYQQPAAKGAATSHDISAQIEQLRNDIFGIAMNVSALSDRLDRLEQRIPPADQSQQAGVATLRAEIETWLEKHLNTAVEHCMHQIIQRTNSASSYPEI